MNKNNIFCKPGMYYLLTGLDFNGLGMYLRTKREKYLKFVSQVTSQKITRVRFQVLTIFSLELQLGIIHWIQFLSKPLDP